MTLSVKITKLSQIASYCEYNLQKAWAGAHIVFTAEFHTEKHFLFSEPPVVWEVLSPPSGFASVQISHLWATISIEFDSDGIITFEECQFNSNIQMHLNKADSEGTYPINGTDLQTYLQDHQVIFQKSVFEVHSSLFLVVRNAVRQVALTQSKTLGNNALTFQINNGYNQ